MEIKMNTLKRLLSLLFGLLVLVSFTGCDDDDEFIDTVPPDPPQNLQVVRTGDGEVDLSWSFNAESDVDYYNVYFSFSYSGEYTEIGWTNDNYYIDGAAENGVRYFYAVTAVDYDGNESDLSIEEVVGIARPEGFNEVIKDFRKFEGISGFELGQAQVVPFNADNCDFFYENYEGTYWINVWDDSEIQDMGPTTDIYDIQYAPTGGWKELVEGENVKYVEAIVGHTYVIWTFDAYYAKIRVKELTSTTMSFDWAFQTIKGEKMLKRGSSTVRNVPNEVIKK